MRPDSLHFFSHSHAFCYHVEIDRICIHVHSGCALLDALFCSNSICCSKATTIYHAVQHWLYFIVDMVCGDCSFETWSTGYSWRSTHILSIWVSSIGFMIGWRTYTRSLFADHRSPITIFNIVILGVTIFCSWTVRKPSWLCGSCPFYPLFDSTSPSPIWSLFCALFLKSLVLFRKCCDTQECLLLDRGCCSYITVCLLVAWWSVWFQVAPRLFILAVGYLVDIFIIESLVDSAMFV